MKASSEKGQVIVLYAIFILFLVIVGLTMVDLGKLVMFKTKLRCVTDQSAFSTSVVERNDGPIVDNITDGSRICPFNLQHCYYAWTIYVMQQFFSVIMT